MGDQLVAYEREDGNYTVHETADGIDLRTIARQLTYETPFGGPDRHNLWAKMAIEALRWGDTDQLEHLLAQDERPITLVRPEPAHCGVSFDELRNERLDYRRVSGLLVVATDDAVTAYKVAWLAFDDPHHGAIVPQKWLHGRTTRELCFDVGFLAVRTAVATVIDELSEAEAPLALERGLRTLVDDTGSILVTGRPVEGRP